MGRTTLQIQHLPRGGHFFWNHFDIDFPKRLSSQVSRVDVNIYPRQALLDPYQFCGLKRTGAAVDHACGMTKEEQENWDKIKAWLWDYVP